MVVADRDACEERSFGMIARVLEGLPFGVGYGANNRPMFPLCSFFTSLKLSHRSVYCTSAIPEDPLQDGAVTGAAPPVLQVVTL